MPRCSSRRTRARAAEAHRYRETLGVQIAVHEDDAAAVDGGADLVLRPDDLVRPDTRVVRVRGEGQGATVVLVRKSGGVLFSGDLDLASEGAKQLIPLAFSSVLSSKRAPIWNAGRDTLMQLQRELPRPRKQFGILLPPPWDRAYKGRLEDKMYHHDVIVPKEDTAVRAAAMGPETLVVASATREIQESAKRPVPAAGRRRRGRCRRRGRAPQRPRQPRLPHTPREQKPRPKPFAEDWRATSTERPATTIANAPTDIVPAAAGFKPRSIGERFRRVPIEDLVGSPYVDYVWGGIDLSPDGAEVAFSWNKSGTFEIYSAPIERERLYQLTDAKERSVSPRWSPDARQLAFLRDSGGNERFDIWLVDRDGETGAQPDERAGCDAPRDRVVAGWLAHRLRRECRRQGIRGPRGRRRDRQEARDHRRRVRRRPAALVAQREAAALLLPPRDRAHQQRPVRHLRRGWAHRRSS